MRPPCPYFLLCLFSLGCGQTNQPNPPLRPPEIDQLTGPAYAIVQASWLRLVNSEPSSELWREWTFATHANGLLEAALEAHVSLEQFDTTIGDQFRKAVVLERLGQNEQAVFILRSLRIPRGHHSEGLPKFFWIKVTSSWQMKRPTLPFK